MLTIKVLIVGVIVLSSTLSKKLFDQKLLFNGGIALITLGIIGFLGFGINEFIGNSFIVGLISLVLSGEYKAKKKKIYFNNI